MTNEITIRASENVEPDNINNDIETEIIEKYGSVFDPTELSHRDGFEDNPDHLYAQYHLSDTAKKSNIVFDLETILSDFDWVVVEHRHTWREYDQAEYADDPEYYPERIDTGLRTPASVGFDEAFSATLASANWLIGGDPFEATNVSISVDQPSDYARRDAVVGTKNGIERLAGEEKPKPSKEGVDYPPLPSIPSDAVLLATITTKSILDRIPRSGIEIEEMGGSPTDRTIEYSHGSVPDPFA